MASHPAGLSISVETLELNSQSGFPPPDDAWSETLETADTDDERDAIEEVDENNQDLTIRGPKMPPPDLDKPHEMHTPSPPRTEPTSPTDPGYEPASDADMDATSVHSMPVVQVTEPTSPTVPTSPRSSDSHRTAPSTLVPPSSSSIHSSRTTTSYDRTRRHRNTFDNRASNRLSGFFSNLIHRRDHPPNPPAAPQSPPPASTAPTKDTSRGSSPAPTRPSTPPPQLPAPTLDDLGLRLSPLTEHLSPSHFSNPPTSGAFLAPHYLLLCHSQGLDVLPLLSPPAPHPYALVRRAPFKSVVIMEHRGVLVAIAGRRDGVRVYALDEIKRMVEWRMEVETRREAEKARREEGKRSFASLAFADPEKRGSTEKTPDITQRPDEKRPAGRRGTVSVVPPLPIPPPGQPRSPIVKVVKPKAPTRPAVQSVPSVPPPAYSHLPPSEVEPAPTASRPRRSRATSVSEVLAGTTSRRHTLTNVTGERDGDVKGDWASSDDEAIDPMAAPSGSQALDERTSTMTAASLTGPSNAPRVDMSRTQTTPAFTSPRRSRPSNLDLSLTRTNTSNVVSVPPPSPTPTLLTLRQALVIGSPNNDEGGMLSPDGDADGDDDEDGDRAPSSPVTPTRERISLVDALFESRIPDLPPAGTRQPQEPILIDSTRNRGQTDSLGSPRTSESHSANRPSTAEPPSRRRRRWSVLGGVFGGQVSQSQTSLPSFTDFMTNEPTALNPTRESPESRERRPAGLVRSSSGRVSTTSGTSTMQAPGNSPRSSRRPSTSPQPMAQSEPDPITDRLPVPTPSSASSSHSRFLPRLLHSALGRRSDDLPPLPRLIGDNESKRSVSLQAASHAQAPKLEYVKLPGTKGAVTVKAVETAKKSFLAILCGDNGEKVELFAGTYRTALGLSRTFILPDSPRSLELQLQGDDLVEVFLVFSQNVFGLEPATVRVREVRIGRAERRAARRRAREAASGGATGDSGDADAGGAEEETQVNVTAVVAPNSGTDTDEAIPNPTEGSTTAEAASQSQVRLDGQLDATNTATASSDELATLAEAQSSPYTTFQQLTFAPKFPLATVADEYIIPPTYRTFLDYRIQHEPRMDGDAEVDLAQIQFAPFTPPGLPVPTAAPPPRWYYRDPKGVIHGPWKASLMQMWYKEGLLPPQLPVRTEDDDDFISLKDLRQECIDPAQPFKNARPRSLTPVLLPPQSLLAQPRHFGPPALFYSSRGGHSTTIVDARGRSVLKGRFMWSAEDPVDEQQAPPMGRLGDVKHLEAFDVDDGAVLVALRQGGLEVVDFGDALLRPADYSRTLFPNFHPPSSSINRRGTFVWKIGTPLVPHHAGAFSALALPSSAPRQQVMPRKKQSTGPSKSPGRTDFNAGSGDTDTEFVRDEVMFIGRKGNEMYMCEKSTSSFRILKLWCSTPSPPTPPPIPSVTATAVATS